jgi:hypothetical protein
MNEPFEQPVFLARGQQHPRPIHVRRAVDSRWGARDEKPAGHVIDHRDAVDSATKSFAIVNLAHHQLSPEFDERACFFSRSRQHAHTGSLG